MLALALALLLPPLALALSPQQRASLHSGAWPAGQPPRSVPSSKTVDGPLLGNGDVGVVLGVHNPLEFYRCAFASPCWPLRVSSHLEGLSTVSGRGRVSGSDRIRRR